MIELKKVSPWFMWFSGVLIGSTVMVEMVWYLRVVIVVVDYFVAYTIWLWWYEQRAKGKIK